MLSVMYITDSVGTDFFLVCFGKVKSDARPDQLITFTRCLRETLPIEHRNLPSAARNQGGTFQLPGSIRDGWSLDTQHFSEQVLGNRQCVSVSAVTNHEQPPREPLLEAVRTVARYRHQDLFEKRIDVSVHEISEGRHRLHGPYEGRARHLCCASRNLDEKPGGGTFGTEDGFHIRETLPTDRCHLNDTAVRINRHHRDDTAIGEED